MLRREDGAQVNWKVALAVLLTLLSVGALLEDIHWVHIEWCHIRKGNNKECVFAPY